MPDTNPDDGDALIVELIAGLIAAHANLTATLFASALDRGEDARDLIDSFDRMLTANKNVIADSRVTDAINGPLLTVRGVLNERAMQRLMPDL